MPEAKATSTKKTDSKSSKDRLFNLGINRGLVLSDAVFENLMPDRSTQPLMVFEHGIRGTQNTTKAEAKVSNVQETHSAKLDPDASALRITYSVRPLALRADDNLALTAGKGIGPDDMGLYQGALASFVQRMIEDEDRQSSVAEIARRYARNIMNGRAYWRNRQNATAISISVQSAILDPETGHTHREPIAAVSNALNKSMIHFDKLCDQEQAVAQKIEQCLRGHSSATLIVEADLYFGAPGSIEVYPSQNYLGESERGFARSLYALNRAGQHRVPTDGMRQVGQAAIRDQKVGNALRTFDTWYPDADIMNIPLAIEPNGANLRFQRYFRKPGEKNDSSAFAYFPSQRLANIESGTPEAHFLTAVFVRGGLLTGIKP